MPIESATIRKLLEDAIVNRLRVLVLPTYLQTVRNYNGEVHGDDPDQVKDALLGQEPAILVASGGSASEDNVNRFYSREIVEIELYLISRNLRSPETRTRGEAGIYQMLEDVRALLKGFNPQVPGVGLLSPGRSKPLARSKGWCIWIWEWNAMITWKVPDAEAADALLTSLVGELNPSDVLASGEDGTIEADEGSVTFTVEEDTFDADMVGMRVLVTSGANLGSHEILTFVDEKTLTWENGFATGQTAVRWKIIRSPRVTIETSTEES